MDMTIGWVPIPPGWMSRPPPKCAISAWIGLWAHVDRRKEILRAWPSSARLADMADCDERSIRRGLDWLVGNGMIKRSRIGPRLLGWEILWRIPVQGPGKAQKRTLLSNLDSSGASPDTSVRIRDSKEKKRDTHLVGMLDMLDRVEGVLRARHGSKWPNGQSLTATGITEALRVLERANVKRPVTLEDAAITLDEAFYEWSNEELVDAVQHYVNSKNPCYWPYPGEIRAQGARR